MGELEEKRRSLETDLVSHQTELKEVAELVENKQQELESLKEKLISGSKLLLTLSSTSEGTLTQRSVNEGGFESTEKSVPDEASPFVLVDEPTAVEFPTASA